MDRFCLTVLVAAALAGCTQAPASRSQVPDGAAADAAAASPSPSPSERLRQDWVREVDRGCRVGLGTYPSLALGVDADIDTVALGVSQFHESLSRVPPADDRAAREEARGLIAQTRQLRTEWAALAETTSVPRARREAAVEDARTVILAVAAIGASACEDLAPPA